MEYPSIQMPTPQIATQSSATSSPLNAPRQSPASPQKRGSGSPMSNIEQSVTKLLVCTKQLLEGLTAWSQKRTTEQQVSDIYVKLIGEFHGVCHVFNRVGLETSDLKDIPEELRKCLEKALSEEASPESLEQYLPQIRDVIISLLQGLKANQALYRQRMGISETTRLTRQMTTGNASPNSTLKRNISAPSRNNFVGTSDPLAALKKSDVLERRASKRQSAYVMKSTRDARRGGVRGPQEMYGRSIGPKILEVKEELDETIEERENGNIDSEKANVEVKVDGESKEVIEEEFQEASETNQLPEIKVMDNLDDSTKKMLTLFLQVGKQVKKVSYDGDMSIPALRMLFIEKFEYNPGLDDFPNIYIKDSKLDILYELENLDEVKDNSVLALNVETLEQVKKHFDQSIENLTKEIRDIKKTFTENAELLRRGSVLLTNANNQRPTPSETQFREIARKMLANVRNKEDKTLQHPSKEHLVEKITNELRSQYDEIRNLRRDLGIMRQLYNDFRGGTTSLIHSLSEKTTAIKEFALTNVGGARAFIDSGKAKLDERSKNLLKRMDALQDIIDELKADVTQRKWRPRSSSMDHIQKESAAIAQELESLAQYVKTIKPMWKKTWEEELQTIVEEQKFLNHQEELVEDMQDDHDKMSEVFNHILKVVEILSKKKPEFRVAPHEEGFEGLKTVMQEVRSISPNSDKRLRALEQAEKARERELANRIDEFEAELSEFVAQNKLKKTGGAEEVERVRQKKNEDNLKELFKKK
ncbi:4199_t:CDS:2 [Paraglomus occultum]|uniref:4199_t:CDS:1 n=1 Tax=Paraglomus occultum TaxID=144539 RepID=A0A9N9AR67_9GLOM|nr:4199_t:CDS:2 [Paraglomus occultum]